MSKYLKQYPWLKMYDPYPDKTNQDDFDAFDCLPQGWVEAFGKLLCEDLDRVIKNENLQDKFRIDEAKEKYGMMRIYCHPCTPAIQDVLRKYKAYSEAICTCCGSIDGVKFVTFGWCSPYCRHCFGKIHRTTDFSKFDTLPDEELPTAVKWGRFSKEGHENFEIDISETTQKIREHWEARKISDNISNDFEE